MDNALHLIEEYISNGHTQRQLAKLLKVSEVTVSRWLKNRKIHSAYVKLIKQILGRSGRIPHIDLDQDRLYTMFNS